MLQPSWRTYISEFQHLTAKQRWPRLCIAGAGRETRRGVQIRAAELRATNTLVSSLLAVDTCTKSGQWGRSPLLVDGTVKQPCVWADANPSLTHTMYQGRSKGRAEDTKLLEKEMRIDVHGFRLGKEFLDRTQAACAPKRERQTTSPREMAQEQKRALHLNTWQWVCIWDIPRTHSMRVVNSSIPGD